jgi:hypothetical protein
MGRRTHQLQESCQCATYIAEARIRADKRIADFTESDGHRNVLPVRERLPSIDNSSWRHRVCHQEVHTFNRMISQMMTAQTFDRSIHAVGLADTHLTNSPAELRCDESATRSVDRD